MPWVGVGQLALLAKTELGASLAPSVLCWQFHHARAGRSVDDVSMVNRGMAAAGPVWGLGGCQ